MPKQQGQIVWFHDDNQRNQIGNDCYVKRKTRKETLETETSRRKWLSTKDILKPQNGIEDYSLLFIVFYMNKALKKQKPILKVHLRGRADIPLQGVLRVHK